MKGVRVLVIGAGVAGLCVALRLQREGATVILADEGRELPSASAVAAGMLAPVLEAAFDEVGQKRLEFLRAARDLWPETAGVDIALHRCGALTLGADAAVAEAEAALHREGARFDRLEPRAVRRLQPLLAESVGRALHTDEDWRLDAAAALDALSTQFLAGGGARRTERMDVDGLAGLADAVVICAGWGSKRFSRAAPELAALQPVKGQLIRFPGAPPFDGPLLRRGSVYIAPAQGGVIAGASMEPGRDDLEPSSAATAGLAAAARDVLPHLAEVEPEAAVGVRAATPDGLPLAGRSSSGLMLATGFRRNGWLLAPLVARIVADELAGRDPGPWAAALRPGRFG